MAEKIAFCYDRSLSSIAVELRAKSRNWDEKFKLSKMPDAIKDLGSKWVRPSELPDYDRYIDRSNEEALYLTYDTRVRKKTGVLDGITLYVKTSDKGMFRVERGKVTASGFSANATFLVNSDKVFSEALPTDEDDFIVYRLTAVSGHITYYGPYTGADVGVQTGDFNQCVEQWGRLPYATQMVVRGRLLKSFDVIDCISITSLSSAWNECSSLQNIETKGWDTSKLTTLDNAWKGCSSLQRLDISHWNTASVKSMQYSWQDCSALIELNVSGLDVSNVTTMTYAWESCTTLAYLDLSTWRPAKLTNLNRAWQNCRSLRYIDLEGWSAAISLTDLGYTWANCYSLQALNLHSLNTSKVTTINGAWSYCYQLKELDVYGWDLSRLTALNSAWSNCESLEELDLSSWVNTSGIKSTASAWYGCTGLRTLDISGLDMPNLNGFDSAWNNCQGIVTLIPCPIYCSASFTIFYSLSDESVDLIIKALQETTVTKTISFTDAIEAKLTEEQKESIAAKGWTLN